MSGGRERLAAVIRQAGGLLAAEVAEVPEDAADHAAHAAAGPRVAGHRAAVELALSAVHEGHELHYGRPRVLPTADPDLALLAGDRLYALGLAQLAQASDLVAIAELADIISLSAQAHAHGDPALADAAWSAGAAAIGWGPRPELEAAKAAARGGDPLAAAALRDAAQAARDTAGM
jgi:hypothetical protein